MVGSSLSSSLTIDNTFPFSTLFSLSLSIDSERDEITRKYSEERKEKLGLYQEETVIKPEEKQREQQTNLINLKPRKLLKKKRRNLLV